MQPKVIAANEGAKLVVLGDRQTMKLSAADTNGTMALIEQCNDPGFKIPLHVHEREDETFVVLEGEVRFVAGAVTTLATAGTTVWAPRGVPHSFEVVGTKPARILLLLTPAGLERMFEELAALGAGPPEMGKVVEICGRYGVRFV